MIGRYLRNCFVKTFGIRAFICTIIFVFLYTDFMASQEYFIYVKPIVYQR